MKSCLLWNYYEIILEKLTFLCFRQALPIDAPTKRDVHNNMRSVLRQLVFDLKRFIFICLITGHYITYVIQIGNFSTSINAEITVSKFRFRRKRFDTITFSYVCVCVGKQNCLISFSIAHPKYGKLQCYSYIWHVFLSAGILRSSMFTCFSHFRIKFAFSFQHSSLYLSSWKSSKWIRITAMYEVLRLAPAAFIGDVTVLQCNLFSEGSSEKENYIL